MTDDVDVYLDSSNGGCYLESLINTRINLEDCPRLLKKLDELIEAEIDLAIMGAEKAKSEILKASKEATVRPIK